MRFLDGHTMDDDHYEIVEHMFKNFDKEKADKIQRETQVGKIGNWKFGHYRLLNYPLMLKLYFHGMEIHCSKEDFTSDEDLDFVAAKEKPLYEMWKIQLIKSYDEAYREFSKMGLTVDNL